MITYNYTVHYQALTYEGSPSYQDTHTWVAEERIRFATDILREAEGRVVGFMGPTFLFRVTRVDEFKTEPTRTITPG